MKKDEEQNLLKSSNKESELKKLASNVRKKFSNIDKQKLLDIGMALTKEGMYYVPHGFSKTVETSSSQKISQKVSQKKTLKR